MGQRAGRKAALIVYRLSDGGPRKSAQFVQKVYGGEVSNRGYRYRRRGFLDEIPHWKLLRGLLMVRWEDRRKVLQEIRKWTSEVYCWPLTLTARQAGELRTVADKTGRPE